MTFTIAALTKSDYTDMLIDIISAPKAPYEPNVMTTAFMAVLDKAFQTDVLTQDQVDYLIHRVAVETGIVQSMVVTGRAASLAGATDANKQLDEIFERGQRRVASLNEGGVEGMLRADAERAGHGIIVLKVDEDTTKEDFDQAFQAAGLVTGPTEIEDKGDGTGNSGTFIITDDEQQKDAR